MVFVHNVRFWSGHSIQFFPSMEGSVPRLIQWSNFVGLRLLTVRYVYIVRASKHQREPLSSITTLAKIHLSRKLNTL